MNETTSTQSTPATTVLVDKDPASVTIAGKTITLTRFDTEQTLRAMGSMFKILRGLQGGGDLVGIFSECPMTVAEIVAVAVRVPLDQLLAGAEADEILDAAGVVFDMNKDFFMKRVIPAAMKLLTKVTNELVALQSKN